MSEAVSQIEDDLNEFEENDLATTDVNEMLTDNLLSPVFLELNHLRLFTNSSSFFINLRLVSFRVLLGLSNNIGISLTTFSLLCCTLSLSFFNSSALFVNSLFAHLDLFVDGK